MAGTLVLVAALLPAASRAVDERANCFDDPFVQVTDGLPDCPPQAGPRITREEMRAQAHGRTERGTSCYLSGRCRLPNAYLYDREIIPRVRQAIRYDGRFEGTSVWALGQRRWVTLSGCVRSADEAVEIERLVGRVDDVEAVINELVVMPPAAR